MAIAAAFKLELKSLKVKKLIIGGVQILNAMAEIYSTVWKGTKENQECTNGDYSLNFWIMCSNTMY